MMRNVYYIVFVLLLAACTEAIDFAPHYKREVVVNCLLTPEPKQRLTLTYSNKLDEFQYESVLEAVVTLYCGTETIGCFEQDRFNEWYLDYTPVGGQEYRLTVEAPGYPTLSATTTMPSPIAVKNDDEGGRKDTDKRKYFVQPPYEMPYWAFIINKRDQESTTMSQKDELISSLGTNHPGCDGFTASGTPMSEPFGSQYTTQEHYAYLRLVPQNTQENEAFYIEAPVGDGWYFFRAASKEYDTYLKTSVRKMLVYHAFNDASQWFDETTIYSNIENGLGIFGAYADVILTQ